MALTLSVDRVSEEGRELLTYGTPDFPIAFFDDDLARVAVPCHWHEELEIVVVTEGAVRMRIAGDEFTLNAGEGYFSNAGILHAAALTTPTGRQIAMVFSPRIVSQGDDLIWKTCVAPVLGNPRLPYLRLTAAVPWQREILRLAKAAWQSGAYEMKDYPLTVRAALSSALSAIAERLDAVDVAPHDTTAFQRDEQRIKKALVFIETNYDAPVTIEAIARSADISVSTCLRLFRSTLDTTPIRCLTQVRLQRAAEALTRGDGRTITEIAYASGFSDASYFNRCFRNAYGMTPREYISHRSERN